MKTYGGFAEDSKFFQMNYQEFNDWAVGELTLSIGRGDFRSTVNTIIQLASARGIKKGEEKGKS